MDTEGKVKEFRGNFFYLGCTLETSRTTSRKLPALVVGGEKSQDQGREKDPTLRNRQVGKLRRTDIESILPVRDESKSYDSLDSLKHT